MTRKQRKIIGDRATRLMLVSETNTGLALGRRELGGWSEQCAMKAITDVLAVARDAEVKG